MSSSNLSSDTVFLHLLDKIIEHPALNQDEKQMVQSVKRHFFENGVIKRQLIRDISVINRNMQNVQILCQGDAAYEQDLTLQLNNAKAVFNSIQERVAPYLELFNRLQSLKKENEKLTSDQQNQETQLHRLNESIESLTQELENEKKELDRLNENMNFKMSVHKHLKKNNEAKEQMIRRLKITMEDLANKLNSDSQDLKLEQQRKQQQLDRLIFNSTRLKQQLQETKQRLETEKSKFDTHIADWRERTRQATQRRNDVFETLQKGEMETRLLHSQLQRHTEKHKLVSKRAEEAKKDLETTKAEIEQAKTKIAEYSAVPESHLNTVKQLKNDNQQLQIEIDQMTKDEAEARDQVLKLRAEYTELESMDAQARRRKMEKQQKNLRDSLEKIDAAVTAAESSYTCFECLKPVKEPMSFVPCGHSVCKSHKKHTDDMLICPECKMQCDTVFSNPAIPDLLSKLQFLHSLISTAIEN